MARLSLDGFKDPVRRPRFIIWSMAIVLGFAMVMIVALGVTSSYWFCANGCHKVQDDTIIAFDASTHAEISCMACHMPVNADPVTFMLHKAEALGELYLTVTNQFELPLNGESEVALEMPSTQCTQCHGDNRRITPSEGIIIDHVIHAENDVACTICHNRIAHKEDFELTLEGNSKHENFMEMTACFRCHSQESDGIAPGACGACHPKEFELKPANHTQPGFYEKGGESSGHAQMALDALGISKDESGTVEAAEGSLTTASNAADEADEADEPAPSEAKGEGHLPPMGDIFYCGTCHASSFCEDCHGVVMPHPADFQKDHGEAGEGKPQVCANCHARGSATAVGTEFCNSCHHKDSDPTKPWVPQHFKVVASTGAAPCFECHEPTFCAQCHVGSFQ